jgi:phage baseplate assembly protein W
MQEIVKRADIVKASLGKIIPDVLIPQYGVGLAFPPDISAKTEWELQHTVDKINSSMYVILSTLIGTRLHQPDFGSMLPSMVFQPINSKTKEELVLYTFRALKKWETRANVTRVEVLETDAFVQNNSVGISIYYNIHGVSKEFNYVLPLVLENSSGYESNTFTVGGRAVLRK